MKFSDWYGVEKNAEDDWFDPIMSADTRLFVDPFLIYLDENNHWAGAHADLVSFFDVVLTLIAKAGSETSSPHRGAAERLLLFPEPAEFCLGWGVTPLGRGSGEGLQQGMIEGAEETVRLGISSLAHFEEMTLFQAGIGVDLISDIACNVLKSYFIAYTVSVGKRHRIATRPILVPHARWSGKFHRWIDDRVELPTNPFTGRAVLLTPARFLRKMVSVDPVEFWDWAWANQNKAIRGDFNYDLGKSVGAEKIAHFARQNPVLADQYVQSLEGAGKEPYDLDRDPDGEVTWYDAGAKLAYEAAVTEDVAETPEAFCSYIERLLNDFADHVGKRDGWIPLWVGTEPRKERHVQAVLRTFLYLICREKDIDLTAEPNTGRGPVDFKFSKGFSRRALCEVKLMHSTHYWHGLETQTPTYMDAEGVSCGYYLSVGFRDSDLDDANKRLIRDAAKALSARTGFIVTPIFVDARPKPSASKT